MTTLIRISDLVDSYRDLLTNAMDAYLSMVSNNLNEVMKQLAIIATMVSSPLSFLDARFFEPELLLARRQPRLGSLPVFWIVGIGSELVAVFGLYWLFRHRGWIGRGGSGRAGGGREPVRGPRPGSGEAIRPRAGCLQPRTPPPAG